MDDLVVAVAATRFVGGCSCRSCRLIVIGDAVGSEKRGILCCRFGPSSRSRSACTLEYGDEEVLDPLWFCVLWLLPCCEIPADLVKCSSKSDCRALIVTGSGRDNGGGSLPAETMTPRFEIGGVGASSTPISLPKGTLLEIKDPVLVVELFLAKEEDSELMMLTSILVSILRTN